MNQPTHRHTPNAAVVATAFIIIFAALSATLTNARDLTFAERVKAQEAIERVYYSHQIGATRPFDQAVPRAVLETKVSTYLKQTVALERIWKTPVTGDMLERELERMAEHTRMPERLRELYAALGNDPFVIQECLARQTLVDRLTRNFFAFDGNIQARAQNEADQLRRELSQFGADHFANDPRRTEVKIVEAGAANAEGSPAADDGQKFELTPDEFARWRSRVPRGVGEIGAVRAERDVFVIAAVLEERPGSARIASFSVPKRTWDEWWKTTEAGLDGAEVRSASTVTSLGPDGSSRSVPSSLPSTPCGLDDNWDNGMLDDLPDPRYDHTAVWTGSVMVVWGGYDGNYLGTGGRYDPVTDTWTPTSTEAAPSVRAGHTAVWTGSLMVVWGGTSQLGYLYTGGRYDPVTDTWTPTSNAGPSARARHTAVWTGSAMLVWGGVFYANTLNDGGRYDPMTDTWTAVSNDGAPSGRIGHTAVWTGGVMVVWGGEATNYGLVDTGGIYDPGTDTWRATSTIAAPSARKLHTATWAGSTMIVWGGRGGGMDAWGLNTGGRYEPASDTWTATSILGAPTARYSHSAVSTGDRMVVWGGVGLSQVDPCCLPAFSNSGGRYDPATDTWMPTSDVGAPSPRLDHTAVWTGSLMIVWGGDTYSYGFNTGGRYDPVSDSWTATSTGGAPSGRVRHTALWTGSLMVVWGGAAGLGLNQNTGGRYDPVTDTWTATSTIGVPTPRSGHTAVWTGSVMVIWGGGRTDSYYDVGGRYDPVADTWAATSTDGAPLAREFHTAVWTGSVMVIWGGYGGYFDGSYHYLNTGGRYDPVSDSWTETSIEGTPSARYGQTAVWTGSSMVVWGGRDPLSVRLNSGGRYDPAIDTWMSTSTVGAPAARYGHSAVWTGNGMVVWGGDGGTSLNTGGRYDLATDAWTATQIAGAPSGRSGHTAVWAGSVMLVWGGYSYPDYFNTGGLYDPASDVWRATSTVGAPSPRNSHTAVWTGSVMVVWGGSHGVFPINNGGRYVFSDSGDADCDGYTVLDGDCDDANPNVHPGATEICNGIDDDCDGVIDNGGNAMCDDGNACTVSDVCLGGRCAHSDPVTCVALDQCHVPGICDPVSGLCSNPNSSDGTVCHDNDLCTGGETCQAGTCTPTISGLNEPNPRTNGYYKRLCHGPHSGDQFTDADAVCVGQIAATFAGISTVVDVCNVLEPQAEDNDRCGQAEDDLMVLALNICRARVCTAQSIDSQCGDNGHVGQSLAESDGILASPSRDRDSCSHAKCLDEEINSGRALELNTLAVNLEGVDVRLAWSPPFLDDGTGHPKSYRIWRRPLRSLSPFTNIAQTTDPTVVDTTSGSGAFEYEVTAVMN